MLTTKSRRQGSSVVLTLPTDNGKKPKVDQEYIVMYSDDGTITLVPKIHLVKVQKVSIMKKMSGMILHLRGENFFNER